MRLNIIVACFLFLSVSTHNGFSSQFASNFDMEVQGNGVSVNISLRAFQNLTSIRPGFALPQFSILFRGTNATEVATKFQESIQTINARAQVSNMQLNAGTSAWNATGELRQWYNLTASFTLTGLSDIQSAEDQDMSWKSLAVQSGISFNGTELNRVGASYLRGIAADLADQIPSPSVRFFFLINGQGIIPSSFPLAVERMVYLNFSSIRTPLSQWALSYSPLRDSRNYTFAVRNLGMAISRTIQVEESETTAYGFFHSLDAKVIVPDPSLIQGDRVVKASGTSETIMSVVVLTVLLMGAGTFFYERRILKSQARRKPRR